MMIGHRNDPASDADARRPEMVSPLKEYRRPEVRRYGPVSRVVGGGSGKAVEGFSKGKKNPRP